MELYRHGGGLLRKCVVLLSLLGDFPKLEIIYLVLFCDWLRGRGANKYIFVYLVWG